MTRLRLRPGLHYAPIDGGVYISGARATFVLKGPAALFKVVDACVPLLEDGTDLDQLVAAMGRPAARPVVERLVETLDSRGLLLHPDQQLGPEPGPADRERYAEALAYLETHRDQPYADFARIRRSCVLLSGPTEPMGPAVRGLLRSGVGRIVVATPDPRRLAALAARHPEVQLVVAHRDPGEPGADVAVLLSDDGLPDVAPLPPGCVVVPVRIGKDLAIVGPAMTGSQAGGAVELLWERMTNWCRLDRGEPLVRPSGDLLAGALAAHLAFEVLCGLDAGQIHVVHGADLVSEMMTPHLAPAVAYDEPVALDVISPPDVASTAALSWLEPASQRWTGLFRLSVPGDLPQMPVALTLAEGRSHSFDGTVIGFGPNQQESTVEAALEGLRQHCHRAGPGTAAAGVDQAEWLLDGALRLLAQLPGDDQELPWPAVDGVQARRLRRTLEGLELTPARLSTHRVPGFGWVMVLVHDRRDGAVVGRGWGATTEEAALTAVSSAIARQQVRRTACLSVTAPSTAPVGLLGHAHRQHLGPLGQQVRDWLMSSGRGLRGRRLRTDTVAGSLQAWCGMVWLDG